MGGARSKSRQERTFGFHSPSFDLLHQVDYRHPHPDTLGRETLGENCIASERGRRRSREEERGDTGDLLYGDDDDRHEPTSPTRRGDTRLSDVTVTTQGGCGLYTAELSKQERRPAIQPFGLTKEDEDREEKEKKKMMMEEEDQVSVQQVERGEEQDEKEKDSFLRKETRQDEESDMLCGKMKGVRPFVKDENEGDHPRATRDLVEDQREKKLFHAELVEQQRILNLQQKQLTSLQTQLTALRSRHPPHPSLHEEDQEGEKREGEPSPFPHRSFQELFPIHTDVLKDHQKRRQEALSYHSKVTASSLSSSSSSSFSSASASSTPSSRHLSKNARYSKGVILDDSIQQQDLSQRLSLSAFSSPCISPKNLYLAPPSHSRYMREEKDKRTESELIGRIFESCVMNDDDRGRRDRERKILSPYLTPDEKDKSSHDRRCEMKEASRHHLSISSCSSSSSRPSPRFADIVASSYKYQTKTACKEVQGHYTREEEEDTLQQTHKCLSKDGFTSSSSSIASRSPAFTPPPASLSSPFSSSHEKRQETTDLHTSSSSSSSVFSTHANTEHRQGELQLHDPRQSGMHLSPPHPSISPKRHPSSSSSTTLSLKIDSHPPRPSSSSCSIPSSGQIPVDRSLLHASQSDGHPIETLVSPPIQEREIRKLPPHSGFTSASRQAETLFPAPSLFLPLPKQSKTEKEKESLPGSTVLPSSSSYLEHASPSVSSPSFSLAQSILLSVGNQSSDAKLSRNLGDHRNPPMLTTKPPLSKAIDHKTSILHEAADPSRRLSPERGEHLARCAASSERQSKDLDSSPALSPTSSSFSSSSIERRRRSFDISIDRQVIKKNLSFPHGISSMSPSVSDLDLTMRGSNQDVDRGGDTKNEVVSLPGEISSTLFQGTSPGDTTEEKEKMKIESMTSSIMMQGRERKEGERGRKLDLGAPRSISPLPNVKQWLFSPERRSSGAFLRSLIASTPPSLQDNCKDQDSRGPLF
ncbi:hypothetical protein CSUI_008953 [Cystoisospora suis]|uniref:Uncharacterized protein n=1 Tax=Cystoisospora suis TaxID=483139 RepID=A0A2C6KLG6_9APIC|nr:hypothetical protein CSUI_008953 [Cystoisospora suis]